MTTAIRPATLSDGADMWPHMRQCDLAELYASGGFDGRSGLLLSIASSKKSWVFLGNDRPIFIFGVTPSMTKGIGVPWMLGTDDVDVYRRDLLAITKPYIAQMMDGFTLLCNRVDARNVKSVRWLRWSGFQIEPPQPHGWMKMPFHRFSMRKEPEHV